MNSRATMTTMMKDIPAGALAPPTAVIATASAMTASVAPKPEERRRTR